MVKHYACAGCDVFGSAEAMDEPVCWRGATASTSSTSTSAPTASSAASSPTTAATSASTSAPASSYGHCAIPKPFHQYYWWPRRPRAWGL